MGCNASKQFNAIYVDDSIHRMIVRDQKKLAREGGGGSHYKPRQNHPLLDKANPDLSTCTETEAEENLKDNLSSQTTIVDKDDTCLLLYHSTNHNDTIDPRDLDLALAADER
mmetsp:Transcript_13192/g.17262  ORF Transcript_13192/g.17262 Transcript_13192/m.17262 type:complete len:112 (+) Transcript_13192:54-389(+)